MEIKRVVVNLRHNVFKPLAAMEPEPITYDTTHTRFKAVTACCSASSLQFLLFGNVSYTLCALIMVVNFLTGTC